MNNNRRVNAATLAGAWGQGALWLMPLIALALRETNGNQIQAAHLLGMNRNTLRKKITEFGIPVKRGRASQTGVA